MGGALSALPAVVPAEALSLPGAPPPHVSAAAVALGNSELLLFGGGSAAAEEATQFNSVHLLRESGGTRSWRRAETSGEPPCARTGHALAAVVGPGGSPLVIVVGGCSAALGHLSDVFVLDTAAWTWSQPDGLAGALSPRDKLSAVAHGSRVYLFGGFGPGPEGRKEAAAEGEYCQGANNEEEGEEEQEEEDGVSFTWHNDLFVVERMNGGWSCTSPSTRGDAPSPRAAHAAVVLGSRMYVFGGREAGGRASDTYSLDLADCSWRREAASAPAPAARAQHCMVALPGIAAAVCFGGLSAEGKALDVLEVLNARDTEKPCWWAAGERSGAWPGPRCGVATALLGTQLMLLGGADEEGRPAADAVLQLAGLAEAVMKQPAPA